MDIQLDNDDQDDDYRHIAVLLARQPRHPIPAEQAAQQTFAIMSLDGLFDCWLGGDMREFLSSISVSQLRQRLAQSSDSRQVTVLSTPHQQTMPRVEFAPMTSAQQQDLQHSEQLSWGQLDSPFGAMLWVGSSEQLLHLSFLDDQQDANAKRYANWPTACWQQDPAPGQQLLDACLGRSTRHGKVTVWTRASDFQIRVWQSLLTIPRGQVRSYQQIAQQLGIPKAARAVASAIAANPVAALVPCHRVIRTSGEVAGYRWGVQRKLAMLGWEATNAG